MSRFAKRFTGLSGTASLMEDLGAALNQQPELIFMGGGNPAQIDDVESSFAAHLQTIVSDPSTFHKLIGEYQTPQGDLAFRTLLADYLSTHFDSTISAANIAISNGGQSAFFTLFNIFAGRSDSEQYKDSAENDKSNNSKDENQKRILLPMVPDYLGYADTALDDDMFETLRPNIELKEKPFFKYKIDFDQLKLNDSIAAVCLSRPANPSGNIVTDEEITQLQSLCRQQEIPLIIDLAYGKPFPNITYVDHHLQWDHNTILVMSLSKLGLPGVRTGIVVASEDIITGFSRATASLSLAPSNLGPALCKSLLTSGELSRLINTTIRPFYQKRMQQTVQYLVAVSQDLPLRIHQAEGAFFLWLWMQDLPISSQELYERLKCRGVLVLSGHHFFEALKDDEWSHRHQCIRLSYCQPWEKIKEGIDLMVEELNEIYSQ